MPVVAVKGRGEDLFQNHQNGRIFQKKYQKMA